MSKLRQQGWELGSNGGLCRRSSERSHLFSLHTSRSSSEVVMHLSAFPPKRTLRVQCILKYSMPQTDSCRFTADCKGLFCKISPAVLCRRRSEARCTQLGGQRLGSRAGSGAVWVYSQRKFTLGYILSFCKVPILIYLKMPLL